MTQPRQNPGFTLIELMIVVAILGVLAAVAIASYNAYVRRSRNAEATAILADIRLKQEAYRGVFHQYASGCGEWVPRATPTPQPYTAGLNSTCSPVWRRLGISFPKTLYFVYDTQANLPGVTTGRAARYSGAASTSDFWYGAAAIQDLDDNDKCGGFVVVSGDMKITEISESTGACAY